MLESTKIAAWDAASTVGVWLVVIIELFFLNTQNIFMMDVTNGNFAAIRSLWLLMHAQVTTSGGHQRAGVNRAILMPDLCVIRNHALLERAKARISEINIYHHKHRGQLNHPFRQAIVYPKQEGTKPTDLVGHPWFA